MCKTVGATRGRRSSCAAVEERATAPAVLPAVSSRNTLSSQGEGVKLPVENGLTRADDRQRANVDGDCQHQAVGCKEQVDESTPVKQCVNVVIANKRKMLIRLIVVWSGRSTFTRRRQRTTGGKLRPCH